MEISVFFRKKNCCRINERQISQRGDCVPELKKEGLTFADRKIYSRKTTNKKTKT